MWGSKWTCSSKRQSHRVLSVNIPVPQEVRSETDEFAHRRLFISSAGGLHSGPELQATAGLGPEPLDGCAGARNLNKTVPKRRVVVVVSRPGARLTYRTGRGSKSGSQAGSRASTGSARGRGHRPIRLLSFHRLQ